MKPLLTFYLVCLTLFGAAQNRNSVWCFGHNAAIDFNGSIPVPDSSAVISRGSCVSICDTLGNLLFYASDDTVSMTTGPVNGAKVYSRYDLLMQNGDSINGQSWYHEIIIIPFPNNDSLYYLFTIGVSSFYGIYYSVVDIKGNGGSGNVIQKNIQLQNFRQVDCLTAVKHGNGRDWWVIFRKKEQSPSASNNDYYKFLITPNGISNLLQQSIGAQNTTNLGNIEFNTKGNKMMYINVSGLMEYYDFDRCSGVISNPQTIFPEQTSNFNRLFWDGQFSPSGDLFYTTIISVPNLSDSCFLVQFNLSASNIALSADTIGRDSLTHNMGQIKLAPDNKIYLSSVYNNFITSSYPYPDTVYSIYNTFLGVINSPDNLGATCDFQPYSFYLGGKRTYLGLPNNPDYDMPALAGSACDTITAVTNNGTNNIKPELFVYYHPGWQKAFINAQHINGSMYSLRVVDMLGNTVYKENGRLQPPYFTKDLNGTAFAKGLYVVSLQTDKERLVKKFVKE